MTLNTPFTAVAPGRVCLFGEHQDYLDLPVIACAIPLTCRIEVTPTPDSACIELIVPQLDQHFTYDLHPISSQVSPCRNNGKDGESNDGEDDDDGEVMDFALSALQEAFQDGWEFRNGGARCVSTTDIPLQSGCSSSTAFVAAWILVLSRLASQPRHNDDDLARLAHRAEVTHFGAPGGTMDHVSICCSRGTCLRIAPDAVVKLPPVDGAWVLGDSGQPKDTMRHLKRCKYDRLELYATKLNGDWDTQDADLDDTERTLLQVTRTNRDVEAEAAKLWMSNATGSGRQLAKLMDVHHCALRDGLQLSTPRIEDMRTAALHTGAWGFKIVGSGGGGCGVAWCSADKAQEVSNAMETAGAVKTWIFQIGGDSSIHSQCRIL